MSAKKTLRIRRTEGHVDEFAVSAGPYTTLLDGLEEIRTGEDRRLVYRHSCHHGSCGTCGAIVNGERVLVCLTRLADLPAVSMVEPLSPYSIVADLAVDADALYERFPPDAGYLRPSEANPDADVPGEIERYTRFESCIECGLCVSVCPVQRPFMGPAALAAYGRELEKHPEREGELLPQIDTPDGVWACDRALACSAICPLGVAPAKHIAVLRRKAKAAERSRPAEPEPLTPDTTKKT